jgi:glycosyltransferase involved in cell wall biosynthesis
LRILTVTHSYPLFPGDATAPFMASIVEGLALRGHLLDVLLPEHPRLRQTDSERIRFIPYRYSPFAGWAPWGYGAGLTGDSRANPQAVLVLPAALMVLQWRIRHLLSRERYDAVHAHWLVPNGWIASARAARRGPPVVVSLHGSDMTVAERTRPLHPIWHRSFERISALTAPSNDLRLRAERLGANPKTSSTVHYGVDTTTFAPREVHGGVRASLGAQPDALLVVAVGRLVEKKGFRYLLEAGGRVNGTHVAIIGEGDLRAELERLGLRAGASVTFTGELEHTAVAAALAAADVFAVPSVVDSAGNVDGLPNTLLEALSTGRPVVASEVAGIPEVIANDVNGLLIPEKDVAALEEALTRLRDSPELRNRLGNEARIRAVRELSWDKAVDAFERVLLATAAADRGSSLL